MFRFRGCEDDHGKSLLGHDQSGRMAEVLSGIQGRFLPFLSDRPEVRATFGHFHPTPVTTSWPIANQADTA